MENGMNPEETNQESTSEPRVILPSNLNSDNGLGEAETIGEEAALGMDPSLSTAEQVAQREAEVDEEEMESGKP